MYLEANKASKALGVHPNTLRRWHKEGKIQAVRAPSNRRLYEVSSILNPTADLETKLNPVNELPLVEKKSYIYTRVSSKKQQRDLDRQIKLLKPYYPSHIVLHDIGSGINFKRPQFRALLERASKGMVKEIVIAQRDRLCRFAFDLLQFVLSLHGASIVVHQQDDQEQPSDDQEWAEDLMAINTVFICKMQGRRAARKAQEEDDLQEKQGPSQTQKGRGKTAKKHQDTSLPKHSSKVIDETVDGLL